MKGNSKPWGYFDTSVLVKRYIQENGADQTNSLLRKYRFISSSLSLVEAASTFRRRRDSEDLEPRHFAAILNRLDADRTHWYFIEPTRDVLHRAERLARENKVRSLDAIHIASTLCFNDSIHTPVPFVTADAAQRDAAIAASLEIIWVE